MKPVDVIEGTMVPLDRADVDTDQIIPQQFLKRIERSGYGQYVFYNWAHDDDGSRRRDFIINDPARSGAKVLVAGPNFGCGSSREHAVWAIQDWGFEAVVAPSFADIFRNNAANIGLLAIDLAAEDVARLLDVAADPDAVVRIDLPGQTVQAGGLNAGFEFDPATKERLIEGLDRIGVTLADADQIERYELERSAWLPVITA